MGKTLTPVDSSKKRCLCHDFHTPAQIFRSILSEEKTETLLFWLCEPKSGEQLWHRNRVDPSIRCHNRLGASFIILNAIRDIVRDLQEDGNSTALPLLKSERVGDYDHTFPSLPGKVADSKPNLLVGRKKSDTKNPVNVSKISFTAVVSEESNESQILVKPRRYQLPRQDFTEISTVKPKRRIRPSDSLSHKTSWGNIVNKIDPTPRSEGLGIVSSSLLNEGKSKGAWDTQNVMDRAMTNPFPGNIRRKNFKSQVTGPGSDHSTKEVPVSTLKSSESKRSVEINLKTDDSSSISELPGKSDNLSASYQFYESENVQTKRLSQIYSAVIKNQLVTSVALEIQLLLRMLSIGNVSTGNIKIKNELVKESNESTIRSLFQSPGALQSFACQVLSQIFTLISNLGTHIISSLIVLPPMVKFLPDLVKELKIILDCYNNREKEFVEVNTNYVGIGGIATTAILTVPFEEKRDSRHNFRTRDLSSAFNNREECRDAFLFQLRAFQEVRGKVLNPNQISISLTNIRNASQELLQNIYCNNIPWFTEFFCDLLLQVGLVPMEETDKEILQHVSDKNKLQKLHRRFTSKVGQKNKILDVRDDNKGGTSLTQPEHLFTGHQEFFFLFIQYVDSYRFGTCLKKYLAQLIVKLVRNNDIKGLEQHIEKLQLLAKFLGLISFSQIKSIQGSSAEMSKELNLQESNYDNVIAVLPLFPLKRYLEEAWKDRRLVLVIPWIVEYLRMSTWDKGSQHSSYFQEIFMLLRSIHKKIGNILCENHSLNYSNLQLVAFHLEILFSDVVGLGDIECVKLICLPEQNKYDLTDTYCMDMLLLRFSQSFYFSSSPHVDDLQKLIINLTSHGRPNVGSGATKKLKPSLSVIHNSNLGVNGANSFALQNQGTRDALTPFSQPSRIKQDGIKEKLTESFFHQHKELQQACEFVVKFTIKNICTVVVKDSITKTIKNTLKSHSSLHDKPPEVDLENYRNTILNRIEQDVKIRAMETMRFKCGEYITNTVRAIASPLKSLETVEMAVSLSKIYCFREGKKVVESVCHFEVKKEVDNYIQEMSKGFGVENKKILPYKHLAILAQRLEEHGKQECVLQKDLLDLLRVVDKEMRQLNLESENLVISETFDLSAKGYANNLCFVLQQYFGNANILSWPCGIDHAISLASTLGKMYINPCEELLSVGRIVLQNLKVMISWCTNGRHSTNKENINETERCSFCLVAVFDGNLISCQQVEQNLTTALDCGSVSQDTVKSYLKLLGFIEEINIREWTSEKNFIMPKLYLKL